MPCGEMEEKMAVDGKVVIGTSVDESGLDKGLDSTKKKLDAFKISVAALAIGAVLTKAISEIDQQFQALQNSINKASTLFGDVNVNVDNLASNLLSSATSVGMVSEELGSALYDALSAGIPVTEDMAEATAFLESSAKTAKGGFADLNETVTATASVLNAYNLSVAETERIQGILIQTQNKGITTVGQLASSLAQVVPTAAAFGVSFEQVGAAIATITAQGTQTAQATTSLNNLISELGKQSQTAANNLRAAAEAAGLSATTFAELTAEGYTITDILLLMQDYAEGAGLSLVDMFGSVEAGRAALQLVTNDGQKFADSLEAMNDTSGLVEDAFNKVYTATDKLNVAWDSAKKTLALGVGPALDSVKTTLANMLNSLSGNRDRAGELESALSTLKTATEQYRTAQEEARTAMDGTTQAMLDQTAVAERKAADALINSIKDAQAELERLQGQELISQEEIRNANNRLNQLAEKLGTTREGLRELYEQGELSWWTGDLTLYTSAVTQLSRAQTDLVGIQSELESTTKSYNDSIASIFKDYQDGVIDLEKYRDINSTLVDEILSLSSAYESGTSWGEAFASAAGNNKAALEAQISVMRNLLANTEEGSEEYYRLAGRIDALTAAYDSLGSAAEVSAEEVSDASEDVSEIDSIYSELEKKLSNIATIESLLGDAYDDTSDKLSAYTSALEKLIELGVDASDENILAIAETIKELAEATKNANKEAGELSDVYQDLAGTFMDVWSEAFEAIATGEDAWAVFAKAGLEAIASVVEALGEQLAIQAIEKFLTGDVSGGTMATAGALAAAAAAGLIRGWAGAFSTGGVVKGPYTGGDNLTASVKAGEVILNHAQAINTARMLEAMENASGAGGGIVIQFNGDVYGDPEYIATMVYNKTKTLQSEGRLAKW